MYLGGGCARGSDRCEATGSAFGAGGWGRRPRYRRGVGGKRCGFVPYLYRSRIFSWESPSHIDLSLLPLCWSLRFGARRSAFWPTAEVRGGTIERRLCAKNRHSIGLEREIDNALTGPDIQPRTSAQRRQADLEPAGAVRLFCAMRRHSRHSPTCEKYKTAQRKQTASHLTNQSERGKFLSSLLIRFV